MGTAAAEVAVERRLHLVAGRRGILPQQRRRAHQDAGNAVAALHRLLGDEGLLERMRPLRAPQPLQRGDVLVRHRPQRHVAGTHCAIANDDVAGAAFARAAAKMRPGKSEFTAQDIQQRTVRIGVDGRVDAIQPEADLRHRKTYCGLSAIFLTTSAHLTMSPRRNLSNSSDVIDIATAPWPVHSFTTSGRLIAAFTAALSLSMIGFGVPAGAIRPSQMVASYPGTLASIAVGTFCSTLERVLPVVARARTWFSATLGAIAVTASIII